MATLTYDSTEQAEGELNAEEQEALKVGEKLEEAQNELLAGKFKDAEDLEKGYIELQKKLGETKEEVTEEPEAKTTEEEETPDIDDSFLNTLWEEANSEYTDETLEKLSSLEPKEIAQMYLKQRSESESNPVATEMSDADAAQLKDVVGGEAEYTSMMQWANDNLSENEQSMYDQVMDQGNPLAAFFAVQALQYRYNDAKGMDGQMLTGKAPSNSKDVFRSQAEVVRAMSKPEYDNDPAYRQDIYDKLERSNLQF